MKNKQKKLNQKKNNIQYKPKASKKNFQKAISVEKYQKNILNNIKVPIIPKPLEDPKIKNNKNNITKNNNIYNNNSKRQIIPSEINQKNHKEKNYNSPKVYNLNSYKEKKLLLMNNKRLNVRHKSLNNSCRNLKYNGYSQYDIDNMNIYSITDRNNRSSPGRKNHLTYTKFIDDLKIRLELFEKSEHCRNKKLQAFYSDFLNQFI
jgi:hypothetical protein